MNVKQYRALYRKTYDEDFHGTDIQIEKAASRRTSAVTLDEDTDVAVVRNMKRTEDKYENLRRRRIVLAGALK